MRIFRGFHHRQLQKPMALAIGNFDGVHRGHQALLALLINEAKHHSLPSTVLTFEPHPRVFFKSSQAPARISTLRDKLMEIERCGIDQVIVCPFRANLAQQSAEDFVCTTLHQTLQARYVLVGDDFRFGAKRQGDYALLDRLGEELGLEVGRLNRYEMHGERISSSAVRLGLVQGNMSLVQSLLGRAYSISGHVVHGQKLGRTLGFPTLNLYLGQESMAASGIFVARVWGLTEQPLAAVASLGRRPSVEKQGDVWLETYCLDWPNDIGEAYGKCIQVELLHYLHEERHYENLERLQQAIAEDCEQARRFWIGL